MSFVLFYMIYLFILSLIIVIGVWMKRSSDRSESRKRLNDYIINQNELKVKIEDLQGELRRMVESRGFWKELYENCEEDNEMLRNAIDIAKRMITVPDVPPEYAMKIYDAIDAILEKTTGSVEEKIYALEEEVRDYRQALNDIIDACHQVPEVTCSEQLTMKHDEMLSEICHRAEKIMNRKV